MRHTVGASAAFFVLICTGLGVAVTDVASQPKLVIEETRYDFGKLYEEDFYKHTYRVKNTGTTDLIIDKVKPGCGCTAAYFDEVIPPGKTGSVTLEVNNDKVTGYFDKSATIFSNDPVNPSFTITIVATIIERVQVKPGWRIYLQGMYGEKVSQLLTFSSNEPDSKNFKILGITTDMDEQVTYSLIEDETPGVQKVRVWKNPKLPTGFFMGTMYVATNSDYTPEKLVQIKVTTKSSIVVSPRSLNFGPIENVASVAGKAIEKELTVLKMDGDFEITGIIFSDDFYEANYEMDEGNSYKISVTFRPGAEVKNYSGVMTILTDDPSTPHVRVRLFAQAL